MVGPKVPFEQMLGFLRDQNDDRVVLAGAQEKIFGVLAELIVQQVRLALIEADDGAASVNDRADAIEKVMSGGIDDLGVAEDRRQIEADHFGVEVDFVEVAVERPAERAPAHPALKAGAGAVFVAPA